MQLYCSRNNEMENDGLEHHVASFTNVSVDTSSDFTEIDAGVIWLTQGTKERDSFRIFWCRPI